MFRLRAASTAAGFFGRALLLAPLVLLASALPGRAAPVFAPDFTPRPPIESGAQLIPVSQVSCIKCRTGGRCPDICRIDCRARLKQYQACYDTCPDYGKPGSKKCNLRCQRFLKGCQ